MTTFGHGGSDPGVSALVTHDIERRTTVVAICNQDRGGWAAARELLRAVEAG